MPELKQPSDAIEFLAKIKRTEHNDIFESVVILCKIIVEEGIQYDINNDFQMEDHND